MITRARARAGRLPEDGDRHVRRRRATSNVVSRDPDRLRDVIAGLTTHSTPDCPEGSNARADDRRAACSAPAGRRCSSPTPTALRSGPSHEAVDDLYASKGAQLSRAAVRAAARRSRTRPRAHARAAPLGAGGDARREPGRGEARRRARGRERRSARSARRACSPAGCSASSPSVKSGGADALDALLEHARQPRHLGGAPGGRGGRTRRRCRRATTLDVELTGSRHGLPRREHGRGRRSGGVGRRGAACCRRRASIVRLTVAPDAATGFRDVTVSTDRGDGSIEAAKGIGARAGGRAAGRPDGPVRHAVGGRGRRDRAT